jgi:hypothetical protein
VESAIELLERTHKDEVELVLKDGEQGWVQTPRGNKAPGRIPYLAEARNRVMERLVEIGKEGRKFDRILWVNDVAFTAPYPHHLS